MLSQNYIQSIIGSVQSFHPNEIYLFGSYARGNPTVDSDIDLLIIADSFSDIPRRDRQISLRKSLRHLNKPKDILARTPTEMAELQSDPYSIEYIAVHEGIRLL